MVPHIIKELYLYLLKRVQLIYMACFNFASDRRYVISQCNFISGFLQILSVTDIVNTVSGKCMGRTDKNHLKVSKEFVRVRLLMHQALFYNVTPFLCQIHAVLTSCIIYMRLHKYASLKSYATFIFRVSLRRTFEEQLKLYQCNLIYHSACSLMIVVRETTF